MGFELKPKQVAFWAANPFLGASGARPKVVSLWLSIMDHSFLSPIKSFQTTVPQVRDLGEGEVI